jgi:hypothetical protein
MKVSEIKTEVTDERRHEIQELEDVDENIEPI